jgi:ATP synthase protein I
MDEQKQDSRGPSADSPAALAGMGVQFLVAILLCLFAGRWLDGKLGTDPLLMVLGILVGAGVSTVAMYRRVFPPERSGPSGRPKPPPS